MDKLTRLNFSQGGSGKVHCYVNVLRGQQNGYYVLDRVKKLAARGIAMSLNGVPVKSKRELLDLLKWVKWTRRTTTKIYYNQSVDWFEKGLEVYTFPSNAAFERSSHCRRG